MLHDWIVFGNFSPLIISSELARITHIYGKFRDGLTIALPTCMKNDLAWFGTSNWGTLSKSFPHLSASHVRRLLQVFGPPTGPRDPGHPDLLILSGSGDAVRMLLCRYHENCLWGAKKHVYITSHNGELTSQKIHGIPFGDLLTSQNTGIHYPLGN